MYTTGEIAANICLETPGPGHARHPGALEGLPDLRVDPDDLHDPQGRLVLPGAEPVRAVAAWTRSSTVAVPGQHELGAGRCRGAAPRTRCGSRTTRGWPTSRRCGGVFDRAVMEGVIATTTMFEEQIKPLPPDAAGGRAGRRSPGRCRPRCRRGRTRGSTPRSTPCTPPARSAGRTASSTATRTTSRPGCCRRTRRTRCCSSRRSGPGSPRPARPSGTASCSACCAASAWCWSPVLTRAGLTACGWPTTWTRARPSGAGRALPDHRRPDQHVRRGAGAERPDRGRAGPAGRRAGRQGRRSCPPTTRSRSPACSGSAGPARCGARSTRATRRRRTASCSSCSTAATLIFQARVRPAGAADPGRAAAAARRWSAWTAPWTAPCRWDECLGSGRRGGRPCPRRRPRHDRRHRRDDRPAEGRACSPAATSRR